MEHLRSGKIKIFGVSLHPKKYKWYLTVHEDADGQVDKEPKFLPEKVVDVSPNYSPTTRASEAGYVCALRGNACALAPVG